MCGGSVRRMQRDAELRQTERERMGGVEEKKKKMRFPQRKFPLSICSFKFSVSETDSRRFCNMGLLVIFRLLIGIRYVQRPANAKDNTTA